MVKIELNGNYNIYVRDLNFEFSPLNPVKFFSEEDYENSRDIKSLVGTFLKVTENVAEEEPAKIINIVENVVDVIEYPPPENKDNSIIDATDAAKTSEHVGKTREEIENESKMDEDKLKDEGVVIATDASKTVETKKEPAKKQAGRPPKKKK